MSKTIVPIYTFDKTAKTVKLDDFSSVSLNRLMLITNTTTGDIIYNFADPAQGATVSGNTFTLEYDTSGMSNTDKLMVIYDGGRNDPAYGSPVLNSTEQQTWRDDFWDTILDTTSTDGWDIITQDAGTTISSASPSLLTIGAGTTPNATVAIRSKRSFNLPFRAQFTLSLSQRIANNSFYLEVVNAAGDTMAAWLFDSTTATSAKVVAQHKGIKATADTTVTVTSTAGQMLAEMDLRSDSVDFYDRAVESASSATARASRNRTIPEPKEQYYIRIRSVNSAGAPASNTNLLLESVLVQDSTKFIAEIAAGRGNAAPGRSIPVNVTVSTGVTANQTTTSRQGMAGVAGIWYDDSATVLAAAATFTGTSRDVTNAATAAVMGGAHYGQEFRVSAESDQAGTLFIEVSRDNTNWRRVKAVATAAITGGGQYAEIIHRPSMRYIRVGFLNGATLQTRFMIESVMLAA